MKRLTCFGLVFFALVAVAFAGNCTLDVNKKISRARIEYTVFGSRLEGRVLYNNVPLDNNVLVWSIDRFVERERAPQKLSGGQIIDYLCVGPGLPIEKFGQFVTTGVAIVDPLEPQTEEPCSGWNTKTSSLNVSCGAVVNSIDVAEWDCNIVHTNTTVGSHLVEVIYVNMTHDSDRSKNLVTSFMLPYENFTYEHTFPNGAFQTLHFVESALKVNYEMPNSYNFVNNEVAYFQDSLNNYYSNATWLTIWWNMTLAGDRDYDVDLTVTGNSAIIKAGPKDTFTVTIDVVTNAYVDGKTTAPPLWDEFKFPFVMNAAMNHSLKVNFAVPLCSGNTSHFDTMWYDPTFGALFGSVDPTKPISPQERKVQNSQRVVVAVVVSVVVVIVILAIAIPTVAVWFRPYLARRRKGYAEGQLDNAGATSETQNGANGWTRSAKPSAP